MTDAALLDSPDARPGSCAPIPSPARPEPSPEPPAELAELAAGFIHEIKNHLGTLSLNLQLLAEDFENAQTPRERQALDRVTRLSGECRKLVDLSNDFLRFARLRELHTKPVPLETVVARMIDFLAPMARQQGVEINWFATADLPPVPLDRDLFEQALLNLMLNAQQAMPEGGTLTLIGRCNETCVCLDVIDTGCGIPPEELPKLFHPFHTTKPDGNGLGLATTRKIVTAHRGTIDAQSEPGRGTKFTIALPAARPEA
jgi:two-component system, NtrC family, sensor histidine kinase HydH